MATIFQARFGRKANKDVVLSPAAARALMTLLGTKPVKEKTAQVAKPAPRQFPASPREYVEQAAPPDWKSTVQMTGDLVTSSMGASHRW